MYRIYKDCDICGGTGDIITMQARMPGGCPACKGNGKVATGY
jgi:DnaJ-class molecular chaperone